MSLTVWTRRTWTAPSFSPSSATATLSCRYDPDGIEPWFARVTFVFYPGQLAGGTGREGSRRPAEAPHLQPQGGQGPLEGAPQQEAPLQRASRRGEGRVRSRARPVRRLLDGQVPPASRPCVPRHALRQKRAHVPALLRQELRLFAGEGHEMEERKL